MADALKAARSTAKSQFTRAENKLKDSLTAEPAVPLDTIKRRFDDLSTKWTKAQDVHDEYVEAILTTATEEELTTEEAWITDVSNRFDSLEISVDRHIEKRQNKGTATETEVRNDGIETPITKSMLKLDRMKLPKFDGNLRKYPEFKSTFVKHVEPQYTADQHALVLRNHLIDTVRDEVSNAGDDYEKLWERLDQKYGNIGKLIDAILFDVKSLSQASSPQATVDMINCIEKAHLDLKQLKQETEMYNATMISMIEQRIPSNIRDEWVKQVASKTLNSAEKFNLLLELLKDWRCRLEYSSNSLRTTEIYADSVFFIDNNKNSYTNSNTNKNGNNTDNTNNNYYYNNNTSYNNRNRNDNKNSNNINNNMAQKPPCWLHKNLGRNGEHPVWRCNDFKNRSVNERIMLVRLFKACEMCLLQNCPSLIGQATDCSSKFVCRIQGCGKNHNELLHTDQPTPKPPNLQQQLCNATTSAVQASGTDFSSTILPIQQL